MTMLRIENIAAQMAKERSKGKNHKQCESLRDVVKEVDLNNVVNQLNYVPSSPLKNSGKS